MMSGALDECLALRGLVMSGCHVPLSEVSEKEKHDNSLYTTIKELQIENKNLHNKIERLKDILSEMVYKL